MAKDETPRDRTDRRIEAITDRIRRAIMEGRRDEESEVADLLVSISTDDRRPALHGALIDAIETRYGTGPNGYAEEILEALRRYCEAAADRSEIGSRDAGEVKIAVWGPVTAAMIGGVVMLITRPDVPVLVALPVIAGLALVGLAAFSLRSKTHRRQRRLDEVAMGLRALIGAIDRRRD